MNLVVLVILLLLCCSALGLCLVLHAARSADVCRAAVWCCCLLCICWTLRRRTACLIAACAWTLEHGCQACRSCSSAACGICICLCSGLLLPLCSIFAATKATAPSDPEGCQVMRFFCHVRVLHNFSVQLYAYHVVRQGCVLPACPAKALQQTLLQTATPWHLYHYGAPQRLAYRNVNLHVWQLLAGIAVDLASAKLLQPTCWQHPWDL